MGVLLSLVFLAGVLALAVAMARANELFVLSVRDAELLYVRGRIGPGLLDELADVVERAGVERALIRAVLSGGEIRVLVHGAGEHVAQRIRNVVGIQPSHRLRRATAPEPRNWGQRLGVVWLAWAAHARARARR